MTDALTTGQSGPAPRYHASSITGTARRTRRILGGAVLTLATTTALVLPQQGSADAAPAPAGTYVAAPAAAKTVAAKTAASMKQSTYEARLKTWINRVRSNRGIRSIAVRPCHDGFAERWSTYLANNDVFRHQDLGRYMKRCKLSKAGEILAMGSVSPRQMVRMWMHSSGHRQIMLDRSYGSSGIAAKRDSHGNWVGCVDFGRRLR